VLLSRRRGSPLQQVTAPWQQGEEIQLHLILWLARKLKTNLSEHKVYC